eukprot:5325450-Amphidinium_carterae.1
MPKTTELPGAMFWQHHGFERHTASERVLVRKSHINTQEFALSDGTSSWKWLVAPRDHMNQGMDDNACAISYRTNLRYQIALRRWRRNTCDTQIVVGGEIFLCVHVVERCRSLEIQASTASMDDFSWAVGARQCSIRIPAKVAAAGYGYYEDWLCTADNGPKSLRSKPQSEQLQARNKGGTAP